MNVDELASAFEAVNGAGSRIDHARYAGEHVRLFLDEPETVRLVLPWDPAAARDLRDLIEAAVVVFGLDGPEAAEERWCRFVLEHAPRLVESEPAEPVRLVGDDDTRATVTVLTGRIHDAAKASARVARKCRHLARVNVDKSTRPVDPNAGSPIHRATRPRAVEGWTRDRLCEAGGIGGTTFDTIRKAAGVRPRKRGGGGAHERFTPEEVRRMIAAAPAAAKRVGPGAAAEWARLLGE